LEYNQLASGILPYSPPSPDEPVEITVRKAGMLDVHDLLSLINQYAARGIMLPRTEFEMSENIRDFTVAYSGQQLLGCGALHFYTPTSGEVRSLAVDPNLKTRGIGKRIVAALENEAIENRLHALFAFTYVPEFFYKLGFREIERGALPLKVWKDCLRCSKFQCCDEIAVLKALRPNPVLHPSTEPERDLVQIPLLKTV
jgi:amino-acid N-acetyltransferase